MQVRIPRDQRSPEDPLRTWAEWKVYEYLYR